jgi:hypothetical protein
LHDTFCPATQSRLGWRWLDGVDAPLGEEREVYLLRITCSDGSERTIELDAPAALYPASEVAADRARGAAVSIAVMQVGTHAASWPATLTLSIS